MTINCIRDLNQLVTLRESFKKDGRNVLPSDLDIIQNGAVIYDSEKVLWLGESSQIPTDINVSKTLSKPGHILTPGLIDSHTHLVFAGNRAKEYTLKLNGEDYQAIADAGGGILSTVEATQEATEEDLLNLATHRIERIKSYGIKAIEIKSGYALSLEGEKKLTKVITKLKSVYKDSITIVNTFMAAHAVPKGFQSSNEYIKKVVIPLIHDLKDEIDFVDIFHEKNYFDDKDLEDLFDECKKLKLPTRAHVDELNDNDGSRLAINNGAKSLEHMLHISDEAIQALVDSETVATLLPGTALFLGKPMPPAKKMLDAGVKVALASDYNPGSCNCDNLLLIASMSAKMLGFNIAQLWSAMTVNAADSLNLKGQGHIDVGTKPVFSLFECNTIDEVTYNWGKNFNREF